MNTALLVLSLVPGLLLIGHGLQKLVPANYSPPLLHAIGPRAAAGFFEQLGLRPALLSVVVASLGEIGGGFLIASGLLTPLGTALVAAAMTTAILSVHIGKGIWNADGGIEGLSRERARAGLVLDRLLGRHLELDRHPLGRR
jgi:putative oxidoreductase